MVATGRGSFGWASVPGTTDPEWPAGSYAEPVMGCPVAGQHVWGALETDERRVMLVRHFMNEVAVRLVVYDAGPADFVFRRAPGYAGLCEVGHGSDGHWGIWQPGSPPRFAFTTAGREGYWREHGVVEVTGRLEQDALQFVTPDADEPLAYFARMFRVVAGTLDGAPVRDGYFFHEQVYLRSGHSWVLSEHKKRLQGVWLAFVTRYADGATDWGQICYGECGWGFAIVVRSDGDPVLVARPDAGVDVDDDGFATAAAFDLGAAGVWAWRPRPGGRIRLPGPPESTPRWAEGVVTRAGEHRDVAFAHTWWESYPARTPAAIGRGAHTVGAAS